MINKLTAEIRININAPVSDVWDALINPETIKKYFFGTNAVSDWKVGSSLYFKGVWEGKEYCDKGTILKIEPEKVLQYNYFSAMSGKEDLPENYVVITNELSSIDGGTELLVSQSNIDNEDMKQHTEQNWKYVLEGLKKVVEG